MPIDQSDIAFANKLADAAGEAILPYFRQRIEVTDKGEGFFDPVTAADKGAEAAIRALIKAERPDDGILGEEYGEEAGTSARRWVLDPVDGTRAFIAGQPMWGTLIALEEAGKPVLGVLDQPFLKERYIGHDGTASLSDRTGARPLAVRRCAALPEAVICTTHPFAHLDDDDRARFRRVELQARLSRYGGDCYAYALVAMGFIDLVIETNLKRWDIAAIVP
ncbi:MAG TPA: inositol monophosphatase family protein, partial [Rhizomicrobium sp.]